MTIVLRLAVFMLLVLCTATTASAAACPTSQPKTEDALLQAEETWAKALGEHDVDTVACLVADSFEDAGVDGAVHDRAAMLSRVSQRGPNRNQLEDMHAHIFGDTAFVRGVNKVFDPSGKHVASVRFTDIFVYRDGRWQAVAGQETLIKEAQK